MPRLALQFHPSAIEDAERAYSWKARRNRAAATNFLHELDNTLDAIQETPDRWPAHVDGTRRFLLRRFPYSVVYDTPDDAVVVVAVAHERRRPGYWKTRQNADSI